MQYVRISKKIKIWFQTKLLLLQNNWKLKESQQAQPYLPSYLELIFWRVMWGSFIPILFDEIYDLFFGPLTIIIQQLATCRAKVQGWVTFHIEFITRDIICSCILERQRKCTKKILYMIQDVIKIYYINLISHINQLGRQIGETDESSSTNGMQIWMQSTQNPMTADKLGNGLIHTYIMKTKIDL